MNERLLDDDLEFEAQELTAEEIKNINLTKIDLNDNIRAINFGHYTLIGLSILTLISVGLGLMRDVDNISTTEVVLEGGILFAIYATCAFCIKINPRVALIIGMLVYLLMMALYATININTLFSGFIIKMVVLYYLVKGIAATGQFKKGLVKLRGMGVPFEELDQAKKLMEIPKTGA